MTKGGRGMNEILTEKMLVALLKALYKLASSSCWPSLLFLIGYWWILSETCWRRILNIKHVGYLRCHVCYYWEGLKGAIQWYCNSLLCIFLCVVSDRGFSHEEMCWLYMYIVIISLKVNHTVLLSTLGDSSYRFGATYVGAKQMGPAEVRCSEANATTSVGGLCSPCVWNVIINATLFVQFFPVMVGDMDNSGSLNAQIIHQITNRIRSKVAFQAS